MKKKLTYKSSGVDIDKANQFVRLIKKDVAKTFSGAVLQRKGSFGSLYALDDKKVKDPVLVSSTDGVGTKLIIAQKYGVHHTVGIDLVAMNVNDILCVGAQPMFFLDYIACGKLDPKVLCQVVKGISKGCQQSACSLIGGETAEMPDMYATDEYDLAGFAVGVVDKKKMIDGTKIRAGDVVIGLPSSGLHSNGFSLVRKVFSEKEQVQMLRELLRPTRIYAKELMLIIGRFEVKGLAHITGGAFYEKLTKVLPEGLCFSLDRKAWPVPGIFRKIQSAGQIEDREMYRTFNMGIGMALVVSVKELAVLKNFLKKQKIRFYQLGEVIKDRQQSCILS
ncbi:MAG: phosphoribosylformylglycinamidine cyclo-ligase [Candidatus Omnitrophica bacterium]|nr:phosphoribosylformylglycinamidine cyclo-ligase [Candidatus Omnitrophota bacterium]